MVATDSSEYSKRALKTSLEIARKLNAEVELLFVMYIPEEDGSIVKSFISREQIEQEGELALDATIEGIDISSVILIKKKLHGNPAEVILKEIENENIELVVMGSHGNGFIVGSLLGSVSRHILHNAKCPVLIVK